MKQKYMFREMGFCVTKESKKNYECFKLADKKNAFRSYILKVPTKSSFILCI